ncbi:MAG: class I SAM-dependent DNA methyltransferase, partial [Clostridia bacterium]
MKPMNSSYQGFAHLYDALTFDVDYEKIADFIRSRLQENGLTAGLVLDLACGTGSLTLALAARGYEMLGADASQDMLAVARQ